MGFSARFLNLVQKQLSSFEAEAEIDYLVVYVAQARDGAPPGLEAVGQWPTHSKSLPPVESDLELRAPSSHRRWYPLQEGSILLGVLRVERFRSDQAWSETLDKRLQATAFVLAQCLGLELERGRLFEELSQQREQITLMVHQLRNPLAALRTYAQLLMRKLGPDSNHIGLVEGLLSEQAQLDKYISALDQLSQPKLASQMESLSPLLLPPILPQSPSISVRSLLGPLIDRAEATANLQGRRWQGPLKWPDWTVDLRPEGDGVVAEIVANLLENAFNYSSPTSSIGLYLGEDCLCVWDDSHSISKDERERIFDRGFRGNSSTDRTGSGLGLALGRELAEKIGGSLQLLIPPNCVDPILPSQGNAFVLKLPVKAQLEEEE